MKRENKAYPYKEQIIELELQEVTSTYFCPCFSAGVHFWSTSLLVFDLAGAKQEKRHQRGIATLHQTEGNDANPAGKGGRYSQETSRGMKPSHHNKIL